MGPICIRVLAMPRLVRELIERELRAQPDMELAADDARTPDFVVCSAGGAGRSLLAERARVRVLELDPGAGRASLHELHEHVQEIGEVSPAEIVDTIRAVARRAR